ncbi:AfsR/SARP family transcriptional regulator [Plantactinospora sp. KLBMP9567]|uniref:AfsR/SARP family transcriptional regulator n=1 Tax=Plantactinospora sp. KLBMP9567 TaxID=3085900 RepID=UPI0029823E6C|nr:BTAD domain-containing putative transcriptional regulator [Plantactinospora sp. KLBMP9567]MDW5328078.1 BTAD domain-containing putative transcriptional regulator [Plantactinospora sp. KLBMP9567]
MFGTPPTPAPVDATEPGMAGHPRWREIEFRILGSVEVVDSTGVVELSASKVRTVLAALLLARGRVVSDSRLAVVLWGDDPPVTAAAQIQTYVSRLRAKLAPDAEIVRQRPGYVLRVAPDRFDLVRFEQLAARGRDALAEGRPADAAEALRGALALWRGPALAGVTEYLSDAERPRLEEARLAALGDRIDAELALGQHGRLVVELTGLVAADPLREQLRGQLMLTLYRCGRQADALASYQDYRHLLAEELGIDPGRELQDLHKSILAAEASLTLPAPEARVTVRRTPAEPLPARLPPDVADFTGRDREAAQVVALLRTRPDNGGRRLACVIGGMAGLGKTALAIHVGHLLRSSYPDGQIYLDLRGAGPQPADPVDLLGTILRALGTEASEIPPSMADRVQLYQSRLAGRRVLVLLDNAASEQQVRPLLPESPTCAAMVTSRARLAALEGVPLIDLDVLEHQQALELLSKIVGAARVAAEPESAVRIVELCGHLPLGVRIAGARLTAKPHWRLARLADRLSSQRRRLDELRIGDLEVRASVALSLQGLGEPARRAFRLLALLDAPRFAIWTAAVLLDVTLATARELLEQLVDARLLDVVQVDGSSQARYFFHDLVRALALEQAADEETADERYAALDRTFGSRSDPGAKENG